MEAWQDTLGQLFDLANPVAQAAATNNLTVDNAFNNPAIKDLKDKLLTMLKQDSTIDKLSAAGQELLKKHAELMAKPELTIQELQQLGVYSSSAYVLTSQALAQATTPMAMFKYAIVQILPFLKKMASLGLLIAGSASGNSQVTQAASALNFSAPGTDEDAAGPDWNQMLADLIAVTKTLTRLVEKRIAG